MKTLLSTMALVALLGAAATVHAQDADDPEVTKMAKEHYKAGLEAYKAGHYDVAIKELKKAYLLKRLPALLLNIGATYRKMGDFDLALHFYQKFLDEAPPDDKQRAEVQQIIAEINQEKAGGSAQPPPQNTQQGSTTQEEAPPPPPAKSSAPMPKEWSHSVIDAAPPDQPIDVRVAMPVMKGVKVYTYYRTAGQADFTVLLMKRHGTEKIARIPADAASGKALQYYIEAKDSSGTVVKSSGSAADPNVIMIDPSAKPQLVAGFEGGGSEAATEAATQRASEGGAQQDMDNETAPITGQVRAPKQVAQRKKPSGTSGGGGKSGITSTLGIAGLVTLGVGVVGIVVGAVGLYLAKSYSDAVAINSQSPIDGSGNMIYFNNDPNAGSTPQFASQESLGKTWNTVGIAMLTVGSIATIAGVIITIIAVTRTPAEQPKANKPRRSVDEAMRWYLAPVAGKNNGGIVAGFTF